GKLGYRDPRCRPSGGLCQDGAILWRQRRGPGAQPGRSAARARKRPQVRQGKTIAVPGRRDRRAALNHREALANEPYKDFRQAVDREDTRIDLAKAALTIAVSDYPNLDIAAYLSRIDALATTAAERLGSAADVYRSIATLNFLLFQEHGFCGNREDYFDPKNSFLNEVLDRKTGIPISLSVLYIEVAKRIGLSLRGVGFPGHFLVKYVGAEGEIVIDPFNQGEILSQQNLETMLHRLYG